MHKGSRAPRGCCCCSMCGLVRPWRSPHWCCWLEGLPFRFPLCFLIDWLLNSCFGNWLLLRFVVKRNTFPHSSSLSRLSTAEHLGSLCIFIVFPCISILFFFPFPSTHDIYIMIIHVHTWPTSHRLLSHTADLDSSALAALHFKAQWQFEAGGDTVLWHRTKRGGNRSAFTALQYLLYPVGVSSTLGSAMRDEGKMMEKMREEGDMGGTAWSLVVTSFDEVEGGEKWLHTNYTYVSRTISPLRSLSHTCANTYHARSCKTYLLPTGKIQAQYVYFTFPHLFFSSFLLHPNCFRSTRLPTQLSSLFPIF